MQTKIADSRGRVNLGKEFANKIFFFEKTGETEMKLELAAVIRNGRCGFIGILKHETLSLRP